MPYNGSEIFKCDNKLITLLIKWNWHVQMLNDLQPQQSHKLKLLLKVSGLIRGGWPSTRFN